MLSHKSVYRLRGLLMLYLYFTVTSFSDILSGDRTEIQTIWVRELVIYMVSMYSGAQAGGAFKEFFGPLAPPVDDLSLPLYLSL